MRKTGLLGILFLLPALMLLPACTWNHTTEPTDVPVTGDPATGGGTTNPTDDAETVRNIIWHRWNNCANAKQVMTLKSVKFVRNPQGIEITHGVTSPNFVEGHVEMEFSGNPWQHNGSGPGDSDGIWLNFFFWNEEKKAYEGGLFEWAAQGTVRMPTDGTLPVGILNIQGGFNDLPKQYPAGTKIAWMWTKAFSSTERSNLVFGTWPGN